MLTRLEFYGNLSQQFNINSNIRQADGLAKTVGKVFKTAIDFSKRHPILTSIAKVVGLASLAATLANDSYANPSSDNHNYPPSQSGCSSLSNNYDETPINPMSPCTSMERSSPEEHMVKGHSQHYHYKDGSVKLKKKDPYPRGGNKDA